MILGITFAFAAAVQPGPFQTFLISQTLSKGWRKTILAAFAPLISDGPIIILVLFLLSKVPPDFVRFLHFGGALFLFYLAYDAYKSWKKFNSDTRTDSISGTQTLFKAAFVNLLNPNPYLSWSLVLGPLFLKGYHESMANGIALLVGFYVTMIISLAGIILLFAFAGKLGPKVSRIMIGLSVIALTSYGIYQLWMGVNTV
ncbi:MAG: LysE family transporter [bacterium]